MEHSLVGTLHLRKAHSMALYQTVLADRYVGAVASTSPGTGWTTVADLQTLINNARTANLPLYLKPGAYTTNKIDVLSSNGGGNSLSIYATGSGVIVSLNASQPYLLSANAINCKFEGIDFYGSGVTLTDLSLQFAAIIRFSGDMSYDFKRCSVYGSPQSGIYAWGGATGRVRECKFYSLSYAIATMDCNVFVEDNSFVSCANGGVYIWTSSAHSIVALVNKNYFQYMHSTIGDGQNGNAVSIYRAGGVKITNNVIYQSDFSAIRINGGSNCEVTGNRIWSCPDSAIFIEAPGGDVQTIGNIVTANLIDASQRGIAAVNVAMYNDGMTRRTVIANNQITNSTAVGMAVEGGCTVIGNMIETAPLGIQVGTNDATFDLDVTGNHVVNCSMGIGYSAHSAAAGMLISSNVIKGYRVSTNPSDPNYAKSGAIVGCLSTNRTYSGSTPNTDYGNALPIKVGGATIGVNTARV